MHMLDDHENDAPSRCMIAMLVQCNDKMFYAPLKWCLWPDAIATMLTQFCIHYDATMMMLSTDACMRCISMMHTCMSWWCTWFAPHNHSPVTNTLLALYPWERIQIWNYMYQNYLIIKTKKNHLRSAWATYSENWACATWPIVVTWA